MSDFDVTMMRAVFPVTDVDAAIEFWGRFGVALIWKSPKDPSPTMPTMAAGVGASCFQALLVKQAEADIQPQTVSLVVRGLEACREACAQRAGNERDSIGPIQTRFGSVRDFAMVDPWGHTVLYQEVG